MSPGSAENKHVRKTPSLKQVLIHSSGPTEGKKDGPAHSKIREESTRLKAISGVVINPR